MPTHPEAVRLNLEYYRKQAKALLKSAQSGDTAALARLSAHAPQFNPAEPALHQAQLAVAREQGFASWPRFRRFIIESALDFQSLVAAFITAAMNDLRQAEDILRTHPQIANAGLYVALVLGDLHFVEEALRSTPSLATTRGGPRNTEPLVYVCFSRFASPASSRSRDLVECARVLLRHSADPNAALTTAEFPDNPLPCLYGATGYNNNPVLGGVLLEAGADPNDGESLYHSLEHPDLECARLLVKHVAKPVGNSLKHALDREDLDAVQLLLSAGADPDVMNERGETALHWAVWRWRSPQVLRALIDHGANLNLRRKDGRTAYAMAVQIGHTEAAALLAARGADIDISASDRFIGACAAADANELDRLLAAEPNVEIPPESHRVIVDLAMNHRTSGVRAMLAAGVPIDARGEHGATALHWACWKGYADLVELLLDKGAPLTIEDQSFEGTPAGWFAHGLRNCGDCGDYPAVARLLLTAGATIPAADVPTGKPAVDAVLREFGVISTPPGDHSVTA